MHDFLLSGDTKFLLGAYIGDVQLHAFVSVLHDKIQWRNDVEQSQQRSLSDSFPVRQQPIYNDETTATFLK